MDGDLSIGRRVIVNTDEDVLPAQYDPLLYEGDPPASHLLLADALQAGPQRAPGTTAETAENR